MVLLKKLSHIKKMVSFLGTPHINMISSLLRKSTKGGLMYIELVGLVAGVYSIQKKKPDSVQTREQ